MTPKEKAKELVKKIYQPIFDIDLGIDVSKDQKRYDAVKQCALIAVDEILNLMIKEFKWDIKHNGNIDYWREVKQKIEIL